MRGGLDGPGLKPWEIRQLTLAEVAIYLEDWSDAADVPNGTPIFSYQDHLTMVEQRRRMTPQERLDEARTEFQ